MSCCLYWVILEERLSVRVLASAVDLITCTVLYKYNNTRLLLLTVVQFASGAEGCSVL